ncbi:MAG: ParB/RepB/Spo0J family partition protein [Ruminococcaceae bacterium]|nr:ParB/RepB/Spo0J family partition protein [Oscillospiraceae bacterium]
MASKKLKAPVNIPTEKIHSFEGHPYKVLDNEEMALLIESIKEQGILSPIIVRPIEEAEKEYEVISGHRRLHAAVKAGMKTVPALIYAISRDEAAIMLVDSNLHREHILPSEKAFAYKLKYEALKSQGKRNDLTLGQPVPKSDDNRTLSAIGENAGESYKTVQRYIRLTNLIPELLDLVDEGKIALTPAVELSYLTDEQQYALLGTIEEEERTPSFSQAVRFKKLSQSNELNTEQIEAIMQEDKANQKETIKFPLERLQQFAPRADKKELEEFVMKACEHYRKFLIKQRDRDAR